MIFDKVILGKTFRRQCTVFTSHLCLWTRFTCVLFHDRGRPCRDRRRVGGTRLPFLQRANPYHLHLCFPHCHAQRRWYPFQLGVVFGFVSFLFWLAFFHWKSMTVRVFSAAHNFAIIVICFIFYSDSQILFHHFQVDLIKM